MAEISKAAVIGAGVMGGAIAAHLANAGVPVVLMDIVPEGAKNRNVLAEEALKRLLKAEPQAFVQSRAAKWVTPANTEDHLELLGNADWIIEAVVEDLNVKRSLYGRIDKVRKKGSVVSSNTSTLTLGDLVKDLPDGFAADFMVTHFFNPPRYMRLLEVVTGLKTRADAVETIAQFADRRLGKGIVLCHDTPGFVANRIGAFWLQCAVVNAVDQGLSIEEADLAVSQAFGVPKTGVFGLLDLVGLDLMEKIDANLMESLAESDSYKRVRRDFPLLRKMIEQGYTGRKGKGGFYRLKANGKERVKEAIDLESGEYRPVAAVSLESLQAGKSAGRRALMEHGDKGGRYAWSVLSETLIYAAGLVPEVADRIESVDRAMKLGYNWNQGPFELMDRLGTPYLCERLQHEGRKVPALIRQAGIAGSFYRVQNRSLQSLSVTGEFADVTREEGVLLLSEVKLTSKPLAKNGSASLWDIGDGVVCLEVHSKMNTLDPNVFSMIQKTMEIIQGGQGYKALVIYNEGQHFSAGVNLGIALFAANVAAWPMMDDLVKQGQAMYKALKYAPFPVVAGASGLAIGGGCELLLHCDAVQAHVESYIGLVETGVGIVPAWGGCKEMLARMSADPRRPRGPIPPVAAAFETIGLAKVAKSAFEAKELGFLKPTDGITFNRDRLLADTKAKALELSKDYQPPKPLELILPGPSGRAALRLALDGLKAKGQVTPHDEVVAEALAEVLTGGNQADPTVPVTEDQVMELERKVFLRLAKTDATLARMEHTLETGKPLRN